MKKLLSTKYSAGAFNTAILLLRLAAGGLMMGHGYQKLVKFGSMKNEFMNFMGLGSSTSLALVVFAEFFCAFFVLMGMFTRFAVIPLIIVMGVAFFKAHHYDFMGDGQMAALFLCAYIILLLVGPGRVSVDSLFGK